MILLFWTTVTFLVFLAHLFFVPFLPNKKLKISFSLFLMALIFPLYLFLGSSNQLPLYYSASGVHERVLQDKMRPLYSQLKKQQGRLRIRLKENPDDALSKALLLELLGVEALYAEEHELALEFWQNAKELLPKVKETEEVRNRMEGLIKQVRSKF